LLEPLGIRAASSAPRLDLPEACKEKVDMIRRDSQIKKRYVILHPGSARREKLWDPARWAEVIDHFGQDNEFDVVLTSGPCADEQEHVVAITKSTRRKIIDLSGRTDLLTLAALIARAQLLVTVDSAPVHLAAATHTPQVILFGPTNPFHWRPRESPALILQGKSGVPMTDFGPVRPRVPMTEISTEAVIDAMDSLLSHRAAAHTS
jgi:heptosyltransferase III